MWAVELVLSELRPCYICIEPIPSPLFAVHIKLMRNGGGRCSKLNSYLLIQMSKGRERKVMDLVMYELIS
jgi:hypothetical protein